MGERLIDGFVVRATTEPEEDGAAFYEPAFRVRKAGEEYEHPHVWYATAQDIEKQSKEEALAIAEKWLERLEEVTWQGDDWNLRGI
ncbi:hypothetical protein [Stenotrophomonas panacihumi]|nr:hypothetical protein [Stenotrophomonas panacihumi]